MGAISALGTTYNLPNYGGELFQLSRTTAPFLSMIGAADLTGGAGGTDSPEFEWQTTDLRASTPNNVVSEGADAPALTGRTRSNVSNVAEIHHSAVGVSYMKQSAAGLKSGVANMEPNPVGNELAFQIQSELLAMKRDINASFLQGVYNKAASTADQNKTRGIITALATNVVDAANGATVSYTTATSGTFTVTTAPSTGDTVVFKTITTNTEIKVDTPYYVTNLSTTTFNVSATKGGAAITFAATGSGTYVKGVSVTSTLVDQLTQSIFDNGGLSDAATFVLFCNSRVRMDLTKAYAADANSLVRYTRGDETLGGVRIDRIQTDFGDLAIALDAQMPRHKLLACTINEVRPVFVDVPGKGHLFVEPLAKTGSQDKVQLYGQIGLAYGAESHHGVLTDLAAW